MVTQGFEKFPFKLKKKKILRKESQCTMCFHGLWNFDKDISLKFWKLFISEISCYLPTIFLKFPHHLKTSFTDQVKSFKNFRISRVSIFYQTFLDIKDPLFFRKNSEKTFLMISKSIGLDRCWSVTHGFESLPLSSEKCWRRISP